MKYQLKSTHFFLISLIVVFFVSNCQTSKPGKSINAYIKKTYTQTLSIPVYVHTNRDGTANDCSDSAFTAQRANQTRYFKCMVSVPQSHATGSLDTNPGQAGISDNYFKIMQKNDLSESDFFSELNEQDEVMVFVHGFNVKFEEALLRSSQIAYDTKFQGSVALFTWPAGSSGGLFNQLMMNDTYTKNQQNANASIFYFQNFIKQLSSKTKNIQLIVHSMGHQVVLPALISLKQMGHTKIIDQLILTAPDYPTAEFIKNSPFINSIAGRVTLYCSPGDNALLASVQMNKNHRIGLCSRVEGIDVINVNEIDEPVLGIGGLGHGYYSGRAILTDLHQTIMGVDVQKRLFIRESAKNAPEFYILRK